MENGKNIENVSVAVNVAVKRFYRLYTTIPIELQNGCIILSPKDEERVRKQIIAKILKDQDDELGPGLDPDLEVEREDIEMIEIDHDAIFFE